MRSLLPSVLLTCKNLKFNVTSQEFPYIGNIHYKKIHSDNIEVKEIQIPIQWGHISGKLWGNDKEQPILALHGWQDNAGTWDTIAPLIYKKRPILAIDLPGHGLSSWIPPGMLYFPWDLPHLILHLKNYYKWNKIAFLCHSMGSIAGLRFASLFPEEVEFYIAIDSLVADDYDLNLVVDKYPKNLRKLETKQNCLGEEPPSYTIEEMTKIWHIGTSKSVALDSVQYLMKRGSKQSKNDPSKYYFSRDPRLKHILFNPENKQFVEALVKRLTCRTMYIKALNSPFASDDFSVAMRDVINKNNPKFEYHFVEGTHHVHLNNPERVANLILQFYQQHNLIKQ